MAEPLLIAKNATIEAYLLPGLANRHGLITGATGTGKTITLQTMAERFSRIGVPVFMADVKGDLTGITQAGKIGDKLAALVKERGLPQPESAACPATLWDVFGEQGHPVRATVSDMGPLLLARMLALNETQQGVLQLVFKIADDHGLLLLDLKDLRAMLQHVGDNEADLLFREAPAALVERIELVVRLVRSKGVGVYFVTQNPLDIPDTVLGQLGNRVQHALRAFTPRDQKAVKAAASTMRANPKLDTEREITELGVGEGLISFLDEKGRPNVVERAYVLPPASRIGPISADERRTVMAASPVKGVYEQVVDRESAYEKLKQRTEAAPAAATGPGGGFWDSMKGSLGGLMTGTGRKDSLVEAVAKSAARTVGSTVGREIVRGVLGSLLGGSRRR